MPEGLSQRVYGPGLSKVQASPPLHHQATPFTLPILQAAGKCKQPEGLKSGWEPRLSKPAKLRSPLSLPGPCPSVWLQLCLSPFEIALATGDVDDFFHLVLMFISCPSISAHMRTDEVVIYRLCIFTLGNYKPFPCLVRVLEICFGN